MAVKDIELLELGALIALLDKYYPGANLEGRVLKGVRQAKKIWEKADIAEDGGDNLSIDDLKAMINVDITAASVTIDVDVVAQSVGNMAVDINAQTIGNLTIDIEAQSVGVFLQPDWGAKEGLDKNFTATGYDKTWAQTAQTQYQVPAGKELRIYGFCFSSTADQQGDTNNFLYCKIWLTVHGTIVAVMGGLGGGQAQLTKPLVIDAGKFFYQYVANEANVTCNIYAYSWGLEVSV